MTSGFLPSALRAAPLSRRVQVGPSEFSRTTEGVSQQIYSLPPLAAWVSLLKRLTILPSESPAHSDASISSRRSKNLNHRRRHPRRYFCPRWPLGCPPENRCFFFRFYRSRLLAAPIPALHASGGGSTRRPCLRPSSRAAFASHTSTVFGKVRRLPFTSGTRRAKTGYSRERSRKCQHLPGIRSSRTGRLHARHGVPAHGGGAYSADRPGKTKVDRMTRRAGARVGWADACMWRLCTLSTRRTASAGSCQSAPASHCRQLLLSIDLEISIRRGAESADASATSVRGIQAGPVAGLPSGDPGRGGHGHATGRQAARLRFSVAGQHVTVESMLELAGVVQLASTLARSPIRSARRTRIPPTAPVTRSAPLQPTAQA